ncbi:hypothetical protein ACGFS9_20010 [Streptomyces sp. NPDC048566]|uniref:hypothetical protein n=1 Tax=Streptomyces sp. NPDC048566 TaxID=3365569 RepID=UPI0037212C64
MPGRVPRTSALTLFEPGRCSVDWPATESERVPIAVVRRIRDEIDARVTEPLASLANVRTAVPLRTTCLIH